MAPVLARRGVRLDVDLLAGYCQVWTRWKQAEDGISKTGQLVRNARGRVVPNPLIGIANTAGTQVRALEQRLGLADAHEDAAGTENGNGKRAAGELLTRRDVAARFAVHMQTVTKWEQDGMPIAVRGRKGKPSQYREADIRAWLEQREQRAKTDDPTVSLAIERARKERAQSILAEQTYQARAKQLLPAADVERVWAAEVNAVRTAILATYTTQADRVYRAGVLGGVSAVEAALKDVAYELLRELSSSTRALPNGGEAA